MKRYIQHFAVIAVLTISLGFSNSVSSQGVLEEIIVTAQKREQSLQDVPISVNAISGDFIANNDIGRMQDLGAQVPNLIVFEIVNNDRISLRGISSGFNAGFEQSVGTFIDGIYNGRDYQSRGRFLDVERVEILRGTQSTYFGNNTIGGALSVTTRKPGDEFEGYVNASWNPGEEDDRNIEFAAGGPITDTLGIRVAAKWSGYDGFIENRILNTTEDRRHARIGRITAVWQPTDEFEAIFKAEYSKNKQRGRAKEIVDCPPPPSSGPPGLACGFGLLAQQGPPFFITPPGSVTDDMSERGDLLGDSIIGADTDFFNLQTRLYQLTLNYDILDHTLTSITGFSGYDATRGSDLDNGPIGLLAVNGNTDFEQWSQELRLTSPTGGQFEYIIGLYYQSDNFVEDEAIPSPLTLPVPPPAPPGTLLPPTQQSSFHDQDAETIAAFGSLTWNVTDAFRGTVGLRYSHVEKDLMRSLSQFNPVTGTPQPFLAGRPPFAAFPHPLTAYSRSFNDLTPSINVQYDVTEDIMLYASYAEGFKAGGFDQRAPSGNPDAISFAPEGVDAYEIGAKTSWLDGTLDVNLTAFRSEYTDLQVSLFLGVGIAFLVDNAAAATTQGLEMDMRWAMTDNLTLSMAAAWMDAKYDEFPLGPCNHFDINVTRLPNCITPINPGKNFADKELAFAPEWSGNVNLDHVYHMDNDYTLSSRLTVQFTSEYGTRVNLDPRAFQESYAKLDARVALSKDNWELAVIAKNLTDEETFSTNSPLPTSTSSITPIRDRQRYVLLQGKYNW